MDNIEKIAEIEHEQWIHWSQAVADEVEPTRRSRWKKLWIPYNELTEEQKDQDRRWARIALQAILSDPSIVEIEVGAELPRNPYFDTQSREALIRLSETDYYMELTKKYKYNEAQQDMIDAGWVKKKEDG